MPELKTSNLYWRLYLQGGLLYKFISSEFFLSATLPLPRSRNISGYIHGGEVEESGLLMQIYPLPWWSRVTFVPRVGHIWFKETGKIFSESDGSVSLNKTDTDQGFLWGGEAGYLFRKWKDRGLKLAASYVREDLDAKVNRYRIEFRDEYYYQWNAPWSSGKNISGISKYAGYWSVGVEYVTRPGGRRDWFIVASVVGLAKF